MTPAALSGKWVAAYIGVLLAVHGVALSNYWYWQLTWFDIPMHISGGFGAALLFFWYWSWRPTLITEPKFLEVFILALGFVALIGVLWEFYELFYDFFRKERFEMIYAAQLGIADTLKDLADDLLGGLLGILYFGTRRKKSS